MLVLKEINLASNPFVGRTSVKYLMNLVSNTQSLNLSCCSLTKHQINSILSLRNTKLQKLDLSFNNFNGIPAVNLATFLMNVPDVAISNSHLTENQLEALFKEILEEVKKNRDDHFLKIKHNIFLMFRHAKSKVLTLPAIVSKPWIQICL